MTFGAPGGRVSAAPDGDELGGRRRRPEEVALRPLAARRVQERALLVGLHALGHDAERAGPGERDDRLHHGGGARVVRAAGQELAVILGQVTGTRTTLLSEASRCRSRRW